jgi:hypothetical protein
MTAAVFGGLVLKRELVAGDSRKKGENKHTRKE